MKSKSWFVYIILASDQKLYTGISTDVKRRWVEHGNQGTGQGSGSENQTPSISGTRKGAKFFRGRSPQSLRYLESAENRSQASQREAAIKKLKRTQKLELIASELNQLAQFPELENLREKAC